ncbi:hypothetical protein [Streptomyces sp. NBC_01092]|uniref:hypothetical protein n=1 Tax=Streptomyces sp. NBC_01092 TaxID=2903748 RepID=UPI003864E042|nr:hypothetical protein OG254_20970 [Streptomyces sp. NBC_01092]
MVTMGAGDYEAVVEAARLLLAAFQFFDEKRHVIGIAVHREAALTDPPFNSVQVMAAFALSAFLITLQRVWFEASVLGGDDDSVRDKWCPVGAAEGSVVGECADSGRLAHEEVNEPDNGCPFIFAFGVAPVRNPRQLRPGEMLMQRRDH